MNSTIIEETDILTRFKKITPLQIEKAASFAENNNISAFLSYWYENMFVVDFQWEDWQEGLNSLESINNYSLRELDVAFCYKLITEIIRQDAINIGVLKKRMQDSTIRRILDSLIELKNEQNLQDYKYKRKPRKCPVCGSKIIARVLYGLYDFEEIKDDINNKKIVLGGCCINFDGSDPWWTCMECYTNIFLDLT